MLLLHCSAQWEPWPHKHLLSRRTAKWPHYFIAERQIGPAGLTTRWICAVADPEQLPSPPKFNTMFPISVLWAVLRRVQAPQVLQFTLWGKKKKKKSSCFHPFLVISSVLFTFLPEDAHLFISPYSVTMGFQLTVKPFLLHPGTSDCHRSYIWDPGDRNIQRWAPRATANQFALHSPNHLLAVTDLLPFSIQNPAGEAAGTKWALE